ncbi:MAG: FG-GAP-like repeat-containing protein [Janthinobacterium lividum]
MHRRRLPALLIPLVVATPLVLLGSPATAAPVAAKPYDFDGDGHPDLVVGAAGLQVGSVKLAGGVFVLPGSSRGLSTHEQVITQSSSHVPGKPRTGYNFGSAFASADFNRDGFADLAIGMPTDDVGGQDEVAGSVTVLFGSASGLTGEGSYVVTRPGGATDDSFGAALVTADFDGDGRPELVVGAPSLEDSRSDTSDPIGSVTVFRGTDGHFSTARSTQLRGVLTGPATDTVFGSSLAVGDVDGTPGTDLLIGSGGSFNSVGSVTLCPAAMACTQIAAGHAYAGLRTLAVGNVSGSARPEIVGGVVPGLETNDTGGGSVSTLSLSGTGHDLSVKTSRLTQATVGVPGVDEQNDAFGASLALGDLDQDGYADLMIGSPGESLGSRHDAGRVTLVYGGANGYRTSGNRSYDQNTPGVPGTAEKNDRFGTAVALSDHDGDGHLDLTVGAPGENGSGAITTLEGSGRGFTTKGARTLTLTMFGYPHRKGAAFGETLHG